jgi:phage I-like protein
MNLRPLLNRDGTLPADHWYQLVPRGEYPHKEKNQAGKTTTRVQVLDDRALDALANSFRPKLLIDQEHWSYDLDRSSEAFGWVVEVQKRDDGLWGHVEWTDLGEAAVKNKRYRFMSPVWLPRDIEFLGKERLRPLRLDSAGLTNTPNLRGMVPLSNRREGGTGVSPVTRSAGSKQTTKGTMNSVATRLGLSAEASEEAILGAVTSIITERDSFKNELTPLKNRVTELDAANKELLAEQIEADLDTHGIKDDGKRARLKPVLTGMKNRADRVEFLKDIVAKPTMANDKTSALLNRKDATPPGDDTSDETKTAKERESTVREYQMRNRCSYGEAWNAIRRDKPELFGISVTGS